MQSRFCGIEKKRQADAIGKLQPRVILFKLLTVGRTTPFSYLFKDVELILAFLDNSFESLIL